jgi:hypothetical protein
MDHWQHWCGPRARSPVVLALSGMTRRVGRCQGDVALIKAVTVARDPARPVSIEQPVDLQLGQRLVLWLKWCTTCLWRANCGSMWVHAPLANVTTEGILSNQLNHRTPLITCYNRYRWPSSSSSNSMSCEAWIQGRKAGSPA